MHHDCASGLNMMLEGLYRQGSGQQMTDVTHEGHNAIGL